MSGLGTPSVSQSASEVRTSWSTISAGETTAQSVGYFNKGNDHFYSDRSGLDDLSQGFHAVSIAVIDFPNFTQ